MFYLQNNLDNFHLKKSVTIQIFETNIVLLTKQVSLFLPKEKFDHSNHLKQLF